MPVDFEAYRDESEELGELPVDPETNAHAVLGFLAENPELGYTPTEIQAAVAIPEGSVNPTLARLRERDLVDHTSPYWSAPDDDRLAALAVDREEADREDDDGSDKDDSQDGEWDRWRDLPADHPVRRRLQWSSDEE